MKYRTSTFARVFSEFKYSHICGKLYCQYPIRIWNFVEELQA